MDIFLELVVLLQGMNKLQEELILTRIIEIWYILCRKAVVKIIFLLMTGPLDFYNIA